MDEWKWTNKRMNGCMHKWINEWLKIDWLNERMNKWKNDWLNDWLIK